MIQNVLEEAANFERQKKAFVLVTILKSSGSTPRIEGANMVIAYTGESFGTIGGGILEAKVIKRSLKIIAEKRQKHIMDVTLSEESEGLGMICGGKLSIMLDSIFPKKEKNNFFSSCSDIIKQGYKCNFLTVCKINEGTKEEKSHYLIYDDKILSDTNILNEKEIVLIQQFQSYYPDFSLVNSKNGMIICSPVFTPKLYILGAGHVAQPTAVMAKMVGFNVTVMDDREKFANNERFPDVDSIKLVNFSDAFHGINIRRNAFIVIITRGHIYDGIVLEQALLTNASYIGMIGSLKKRDLIFEELKQKGFKNENIKRVKSPIGIDIGSETPEEIALSIVAEMVLVRAGGEKRKIMC